MRVFPWIGFLLVLLSVGMSCRLDEEIETKISEGEAGGVLSVHVSDGDLQSRPVYSWSEVTDKTAQIVTVSRDDNPNTAIWEVVSDQGVDNVLSPVTHGTPPVNSHETAIQNPEMDLSTDIWYRVTVHKTDPGKTSFRKFLIKP